jgi:hypothetical protein
VGVPNPDGLLVSDELVGGRCHVRVGAEASWTEAAEVSCFWQTGIAVLHLRFACKGQFWLVHGPVITAVKEPPPRPRFQANLNVACMIRISNDDSGVAVAVQYCTTDRCSLVLS